ncbi:hypothetical protein [Halolamina sp.]|jgi:hypothetical protein|uniref:DUF7521 family protein n=1 Tax=Halolamina sp. TaxID=1940283 RepID=UPI000223B6BC|nr:hypothetical protein Halar_1257 [halophilic archaeon DL31]
MAVYETVDFALSVLATASVLLGLAIAYQAYRGLRRHHDRQMFFLSTGMVLLFGASYGLALGSTLMLEATVVPLLYQELLRVTVRLFQVAGLCCIAYSMYAD